MILPLSTLNLKINQGNTSQFNLIGVEIMKLKQVTTFGLMSLTTLGLITTLPQPASAGFGFGIGIGVGGKKHHEHRHHPGFGINLEIPIQNAPDNGAPVREAVPEEQVSLLPDHKVEFPSQLDLEPIKIVVKGDQIATNLTGSSQKIDCTKFPNLDGPPPFSPPFDTVQQRKLFYEFHVCYWTRSRDYWQSQGLEEDVKRAERWLERALRTLETL